MSDAIALVLLPPPQISALIDPLRSANDKSYARGWASHITILFPFAPAADLDSLVCILRRALSNGDLQPFDVKLDKVSHFATRDYETIYLGLSKSDVLQTLWNICVGAMKHPASGRAYTPHLTLGQTTRNAEAIAFLTDKGIKILKQHDLSWHVDNVVLLRRRDDLEGVMEMYAQIPIGSGTVAVPRAYGISGTPTFHYDGNSWLPAVPTPSTQTSITLATYNVLHDSAFPLYFRFSGVRDAIIDSNADVICLQEVTDEFLGSILGDSLVRHRFRWCSRPDKAVMESERNVIILGRELYGFEWARVELGGKHKAAIVACLRTLHNTVVIAGIHLTAGRTSPMMEKKREEISILLDYLRRHHQTNEWVIIGDTNWPESEQFPLGEELIDVSSVAGLETYDPTMNTLAAATARESCEPQRYDRIFIKRGCKLSVIPESIQLFGLPLRGTGPASDHWGLKAAIHFGTPVEPLTIPAANTVPVSSLAVLPTIITDADLHDLCTQFGCFPSDDQNDTFSRAVDSLRIFVSNLPSHAPSVYDDTSLHSSIPTSAVQLVVSPVGSYAIGCHTPVSDVDCIVVGNINPGTFWDLMRSKIRTTVSSFIKLRRFVKDASVQLMELEVHGVKMDIQYCPAGKLINCWAELPSIPPDSPLFSLPVPALRTLNAHRDVLALQKTLPSLDNFRIVHRALKLFLDLHGLIGARFGFLGGFHLSILLARVCRLLPPLATPAQILRVFFHTYARWDWERDTVTVPVPGVGMGTYRRSMTREPMCVLTVEKPMVNTTGNANFHSLEVIKSAFKFADASMVNGLSWSEICVGRDGSPPFRRFVKGYKTFVKIEINYWGSSCMKGRALVGWLESRFVNLLVQLHANAPSLRARLWPARFTDGNEVDDHSLLGFYLFGLAPNSTSHENKLLARKENAHVTAALFATLRAFESTIQQNTHYDPVDTFISVAAISFSQLPTTVVLDTHNWSDNGFDDEDDTVDTDDKDMDADGGVSDKSIADYGPPSTLKKNSKDRTTPRLLAAKLRTSSDVFNRLLWDPSVSSVDYIIGYEDRFKGVKEMPLCSWKREVEDEAFIPFHRVVHFRRKSDNTFVWDRKTKTDLVFGSGVNAPSS